VIVKQALLWAALGAAASVVAAPVTDAALKGPRVAQAAERAARIEDASANGVIVQLRHALPNVPEALTQTPHLAKTLPTSGAWAAVLKASSLQAHALSVAPDLTRAPDLRPVGAAAQLLTFQRRLTGPEAQALAQQLAAHPDVAWAVPNTREQRQQAGPPAQVTTALNPPGDPLFAGPLQQWWLQPVSGSDANAIDLRLRGVPGIQSAWRLASGSAVVAVLDTGITPHPELVGRILPGWDFVSDWDPAAARGYANDGSGRDSDPSDPGDGVSEADQTADPTRFGKCTAQVSSWHGTIIAGMLAGLTDNGQGVAAMQWAGRVVPVRVAGQCGADVADVVDGMRWAAGLPVAGVPVNANPARIINMSFGGDAPCNAAYTQAIAELKEAPGGGAVLFAAAGNRSGSVSRPANCPGALAVGALNRDGFKANYASFGAAVALTTVGGDDADGVWGELMADSGLSTITNDGTFKPELGGYARVYGTSFSAPIASGVAALMLSRNPTLTAAQIEAGLRASARPHVTSPFLSACSAFNPGRCACTTTTCGAGILDAEQALLYAASPDAYVPPAAQAVVLNNDELRRAAALGADRPPLPGAMAAVQEDTGGGALSWQQVLALMLVLVGWQAWSRLARQR
jgi:serine protease